MTDNSGENPNSLPAAGTDIWNSADIFHFIAAPISGSATIIGINIPKMLQDKLRDIISGTSWVRSDGIATATTDSMHLHLAFESVAAVQHDEVIKQANEQKQRTTVPVF